MIDPSTAKIIGWIGRVFIVALMIFFGVFIAKEVDKHDPT